MPEVRNIYLSRCPCEEADDLGDLERLFDIMLWTTDSTVKTTTCRVTSNNLNPPQSEYEECRCIIGSGKGNITPESAKMNSTIPGSSRPYKCNFKIWSNPELSRALEDYFRQKNMLVEASSSDM